MDQQTVNIDGTDYYVGHSLTIFLRFREETTEGDDLEFEHQVSLVFADKAQRNQFKIRLDAEIATIYRNHPGVFTLVRSDVPVLQKTPITPHSVTEFNLEREFITPLCDAAGVVGFHDGIWVYKTRTNEGEWSFCVYDVTPGQSYEFCTIRAEDLLKPAWTNEDDEETIQRYLENYWFDENGKIIYPPSGNAGEAPNWGHNSPQYGDQWRISSLEVYLKDHEIPFDEEPDNAESEYEDYLREVLQAQL